MTDLTLTSQQTEALSDVQRWLDRGSPQVFRLFGYAGTGKTSIARLLQKEGRKVIYCAFTGKAASVLQAKGCNARTLHSLLYTPVTKNRKAYEDARNAHASAVEHGASMQLLSELRAKMVEERRKLGNGSFSLNSVSTVRDANVVVLDEASMVGGRLADDLLSFGVPVLALGDPAQLPPVRAAGYFTTGEPDYMLTEIMRQSAGSPILGVATDYREERHPPFQEGAAVSVTRRGTSSMDDLLSHDQVIVGRNITRRQLNRMIRAHLGRTDPLPVVGDRLVCRRNNADLGLLNGSQWTVVEVVQEEPADIVLEIASVDDPQNVILVSADKFCFTDPEHVAAPFSDSQAFDYAFAITAHVAQGSQWESVYVVDEGSIFRQDQWKWRYTAVTRASERLTVSR
jgi:exodeoxyribonuclease-5